MATDTEANTPKPSFEEQFGELASARTEALKDMRYYKLSGLRSGVEEAGIKAAEAYHNMVVSTAHHLLGKSPQDRATLLEQLGDIGTIKSFYGIESVGFDSEKFKEEVQEALKTSEEQTKELIPA